MKTVGITGPAGSGKSTLFRALAGATASGDIAVVEVPDSRLDKLAELHASKKRVGAQVEVVDVHAGAKTPAAATARLRDFDALLLVLPAFGGQAGETLLKGVTDDLILADMGPFETRLHRARKDSVSKQEVPALEAGLELLQQGRLLREGTWTKPEQDVFSPLAPITLKPLIVVLNVDEETTAATHDIGLPVFSVSASLESEVAGLAPEEALTLLQAYGVSEPVLGKVIRGVYESLDLITFFTTSDKESRAWEVRRGATAPEAAGVIHSDLQRGFIRAETAPYDDIVAAGSWDAAKSSGKVRSEGKDYVFKEGDVTHFRFAV